LLDANILACARKKRLLSDGSIERSFVRLGGWVAVDDESVRAGFELARRHGNNHQDAALPAAAECLGAPIFYTEDLTRNQACGSVRAVNPFL